jgi:hypothetical protein
VELPGLLATTGGGNGTLFVLLVFLHAMSALAGFGSLGFAGTYASRAAHMRAGTSFEDAETEELTRYFERPARFWKAMLLVPVFGVLALLAQPDGKGIDQVWTIGALLVWAAASVLAAGVVMPGLRVMQAMLAEVVPTRTSEATPGTGDAHEPAPPALGTGSVVVPQAESGAPRPTGTPGQSAVAGPAGEGVALAAWWARFARAGVLAGRAAAACDLLFFAALALMIWRP